VKLIPRPEQEGAIQRMLTEPTHAVALGSQQDTGKTLMLCEVIVRAEFKRVLIVGVKDTFNAWHKRLLAQSEGSIELLRIDATKKGRENFERLLAGDDAHFFVGHQFLASKDWGRVPVLGNDGEPTGEYKRKHLGVYKKMRPLDALVSDESQIHSNRKSNGAGTIRAIPTNWKFALSGTIAGNQIVNLHTIGRWLWPTVQTETGEFLVDPSFYRWRDQWCEVESKYVGGARPVAVVLGEKNPGAIVSSWPCWIRLLSPAGNVPEPELIHVDLDPQEQAIYSQCEEEGVMWLEQNGNLEPIVMNLPVTKRTRLRTAALGVMSIDSGDVVHFASDAQSTKMRKLREILDGEGWAGKQAVIFTHSKTFAYMAAARMNGAGYATGLWTGDLPSKKRDVLLEAFTSGEVRYIVAVIQSLSRGYDGLQTAANRVVWMSRSDDTEQNDQAARRVFRTGGDLKDYRSVEIVANETYDLGVFNADRAKVTSMNASLEAKLAS